MQSLHVMEERTKAIAWIFDEIYSSSNAEGRSLGKS